MSDSFQLYVLDQLKSLRPVTCRSMFGGYGLSKGDRFFGILFQGRLYFKVSEKTRHTYVEAGSTPFSPTRSQTLLSFYEVPIEILENTTHLTDWAQKSIAQARPRSPKNPPPLKRKRLPSKK